MAAYADAAPTFAALLRRYRLAVRMTQEELAERAGLSVEAIGALERGTRTAPHQDTIARLAEALGLTAADRARLQTAAPRARSGVSAGASAPQNPRHNLPATLTSFIGREHELAELQQLLGRARLVTVTGTGGVGKTRLALEAAANVFERYPDGVWLIELAALTDPALVLATVASTPRVREDPGRPLLEALVAALRQRRALLLLDNCEHLIAACAEAADALLRACPGLCILATSRAALDVNGEAVARVSPLALPDAVVVRNPATALHAEAIALFVERAALACPGFTLTPDDVAAVVAVCRQLDGLPLALELAAARLRVLSVGQVAERLNERFRLLTGGNRTAPPRQQALRATLDWSYGLLTDPGRRLFARLAVFAGRWALEAAEAVCAGAGIERTDVLNLLVRLVEQSLVQAEEQPDGSARYRLLETLRQYGWERLEESGDAAIVAGQHAAHFLAVAEAVGRAVPHQVGWPTRSLEAEYARLDLDVDNLRAAVSWFAARPEHRGERLRLVAALALFWFKRGRLTEGRTLLEAALAAGADAVEAATLALACYDTARLAEQQGDYAVAHRHFLAAVAVYRRLGDRWSLADTLRWASATAPTGDGGARADELIAESLALFKALGDPIGVSRALKHQGELARQQGDYERATALYEESLAVAREAGEPPPVLPLINLGFVAQRQGDPARAARRFAQALGLLRTLDARRHAPVALAGFVAVALAGQPERAARLFGAVDAHLEATGLTFQPTDRLDHERNAVALREQLGDEPYHQAWSEGRGMPFDEALASIGPELDAVLALNAEANGAASDGPTAAPSPGPSGAADRSPPRGTT